MALSKGDVELVIRMNAADVERITPKIAGMYRQLEAGASKHAAAHNRMMAGYAQGLNQVMTSLRGVAAMAGVGGGVGAILMDLAGSMAEVANKRIAFENALTPLLAMGNNIQNINAVKKEVLSLGVGYRKTTDEVIQFLFQLQSRTANLPIDQYNALKKETLELAEATGGTLAPAVAAMATTWNVYGKEGLKSVNNLQNLLMKTADDSALEMDDLANFLPVVLGTAKFVGATIEELLGTIVAATQVGGRPEAVFTGLKSMMIIMETGAKSGIKFTGNLMDKLKQMKGYLETDKQAMIDLFGRETIDNVTALASQIDVATKSTEELKNMAENADLAFARTEKRLQDTNALMAFGLETSKKYQENVVNNPDLQEPSTANFTARLESSRSHAKTKFGDLGYGVPTNVAAWAGTLSDSYVAEGRAMETAQVAASGNEAAFKARMLEDFKRQKAADIEKLDKQIADMKYGAPGWGAISTPDDEQAMLDDLILKRTQRTRQVPNRALYPIDSEEFKTPGYLTGKADQDVAQFQKTIEEERQRVEKEKIESEISLLKNQRNSLKLQSLVYRDSDPNSGGYPLHDNDGVRKMLGAIVRKTAGPMAYGAIISDQEKKAKDSRTSEIAALDARISELNAKLGPSAPAASSEAEGESELYASRARNPYAGRAGRARLEREANVYPLGNKPGDAARRRLAAEASGVRMADRRLQEEADAKINYSPGVPDLLSRKPVPRANFDYMRDVMNPIFNPAPQVQSDAKLAAQYPVQPPALTGNDMILAHYAGQSGPRPALPRGFVPGMTSADRRPSTSFVYGSSGGGNRLSGNSTVDPSRMIDVPYRDSVPMVGGVERSYGGNSGGGGEPARRRQRGGGDGESSTNDAYIKALHANTESNNRLAAAINARGSRHAPASNGPNMTAKGT